MLAENLNHIRGEIAQAAKRSGRTPDQIRIIAVTKTVDVEQVRAAAALGLHEFGENRFQEARDKVNALPGLTWHFIGHLQSNKVRDVINSFSLIHSLDRLSLAEAIQRWGERLDRHVSVLVQVNVSGEDSKYGVDPEGLPDFLAVLRDFDRIRVEGLMTMAPWVDDPEAVRPVFRRLRQLRDAGGGGAELSMGMTNDYAVAIEEGATMVRIGSALFGKRRG